MAKPADGGIAPMTPATKETSWEHVAVGEPEHEDRMDREQAKRVWTALQSAGGLSGEPAMREVKLATWVYATINGSSRYGNYQRNIVTGSGTKIPASVIPRQVGRDRIRQFLRADVEEAYRALKQSSALLKDSVYVAICAENGVPVDYVHCGADFLRGCSLLTPEEQRYSQMLRNVKFTKAAASRSRPQDLQIEEQAQVHNVTAGQRVTKAASVGGDEW